MKWFDLFPLDWRTGATFVHDWFALGIWVAVLGHILFAVQRRRRARQHDRRHRARGMGAHEGTPLVRGAAVLTSAAWTPTPRSPPPATTSPAPDTSSRISCASRASAPTRRTTTTSTRARDAVADLMRDAGLDDVRELRVDGGHPYVVGEWTQRPDAPTVLLYAHHDVQPPGYVDRWSSRSVRTGRARRPALRPRHRRRQGGRGRARRRGARLARHRRRAALQREGAGRGRGGDRLSRARAASSTAHADALRADVLLLADAGNWSVGMPGLTYSLRGLAGVDVRVRALDGPVHSGMAGGVVPDPVLGLARMLATLVDEHGDAAFDGCWDDYAAARRRRARPHRALPEHVDGLRRAWGVRDGVQLAGDPVDRRCSSASGCGPRSPSSASTATRSPGRRTRSSPRRRRG